MFTRSENRCLSVKADVLVQIAPTKRVVDLQVPVVRKAEIGAPPFWLAVDLRGPLVKVVFRRLWNVQSI